MECIIPGQNIRIFSKMIQCMQKIGEDLYVEACYDQLIMRTLNNARSAYFEFSLHRDFFEKYDMASPPTPQQQEPTPLRCRLLLKPCLAVFRSAMNQVEYCKMSLGDEEQMIFALACKNGVRKTYKLNVEESEPLQAIYDKDSSHNRVVATPKLLNDIIQNYPPSIDGISFYFKHQERELIIKSFLDEQTEERVAKQLSTETTVGEKDFEKWQIHQELDLTFAIKELKSILAFCESANQSVSIYMSENGKYASSTDFVLATMECADTMSESQPANPDQLPASGMSGVSSGRNENSFDPQSGQSRDYNDYNYASNANYANMNSPNMNSPGSVKRRYDDMQSVPSAKRSPQEALWDDGSDGEEMMDIDTTMADLPASPES